MLEVRGKSSMQVDCPKVVIVILNWDGLLDALECLASVQKITYPNFAVVVVDNGSKGNDSEIIKRKFEDFVSVIKIEKNIGITGGYNVGIREAQRIGAKYIFLLNNDTIVDPNVLTESVKVFENDEQIGIVGPKTYFYEQPTRLYCMGGNVNLWTGITPPIGLKEIDKGQYDTIEEVDYVGMLLIKEETIQKIGLLDDIYFTYYCDTDFCVRARKAGFKVVYVPKAIIWHKSYDLKTTSSEALKVCSMTKNRFIFVKRNSSAIQFVVFNLYFLMTDLTFQTINKLFMQPQLVVAYLKGIWAGLHSLAPN